MKSKKWSFASSFFGALVGSILTIILLANGLISIEHFSFRKEKDIHPAPLPQKTDTETIKQVIEVKNNAEIYKQVIQTAMPSVVGITTVSIKQDFWLRPFASSGIGTGVIVDSKGYILTNSHVVEDGTAEEVHVILFDGEKIPAQVLWTEKELDLAVIKVERENLPVALLGNSDRVEVGDIAIAIGNPLGLQFDRSVTQGIISGLNRSIEVSNGSIIEDLIQTDASINQGNSGGPLLNLSGEIIGINSAKVQTAEGLGFAIPINIAKPIVDEFIQKGEFQRVYLGIRRPVWVDLNYYQQFMEVQIESESQYGIYVESVIADSPAERAGIRDGDIITKIDGETLDTNSKLVRILYRQRPGKSTDIVFLRNGREIASKIEF